MKALEVQKLNLSAEYYFKLFLLEPMSIFGLLMTEKGSGKMMGLAVKQL